MILNNRSLVDTYLANKHELLTSMIDERLIRANRPCCIPRSNRRTATFGEGYDFLIRINSLSNKDIAYNFDVDLDFADSEPGNKYEDGHAENEPKVLLTDHMGSAKVPGSSYWVIDITFIVHSQYFDRIKDNMKTYRELQIPMY